MTEHPQTTTPAPLMWLLDELLIELRRTTRALRVLEQQLDRADRADRAA